MCDSLIKLHENRQCVKRIVADDEKWVHYNNMEWKKSWEKLNESLLTVQKKVGSIQRIG